MQKSGNIAVVIGIVGMPGAKKTEVANMLSRYGIPYFTLSTILRQELEKRQLKATPVNYANLAFELRKKHGKDFLAREALKSINSRAIIIDGIRSPNELDFFCSVADYLFVVLVHASPETRFGRFRQSGNLYLSTKEQFDAQEKDNLKIGLGEIIAKADYAIINEDYCTMSLREQVDAFHRFLRFRVPMIEDLRGDQT